MGGVVWAAVAPLTMAGLKAVMLLLLRVSAQ